MAEYAARAAKLEGKKDPKPWLALADFAEEHLLWDKRLEALKKAVEVDPDNTQAHDRLDEAKYGSAWLPVDEAEAKEEQEMTAQGLVFYGAKWDKPVEVDKSRKRDRKAERWNVQVRLDTPHLIIFSDQPLAATRALAALLENTISAYQKYYGKSKLWMTGSKSFPLLKIYAFADRKTFTQFSQPLGNPSDNEVYDPAYRILYVTTSPEPSRRQVVWKMCVALDDLNFTRYPIPQWLETGTHSYFDASTRGRQVILGSISPTKTGDVARLQEALKSANVQELMCASQEKLLPPDKRTRERNTLLSWAWVHFLRHGHGGKWTDRFRNFVAGRLSRVSVGDFEKTVGRIADLEPAFKIYVEERLIPAVKAELTR